MDEKVYTTEEKERENTLPSDIRYAYFGSRVEIDGTGYPVIAAIPFGRLSGQLPTAAENLQKLVEKKKKKGLEIHTEIEYDVVVSYSVRQSKPARKGKKN